MQNIFDYIELGPNFPINGKFSESGGVIYNKYLSKEVLCEFANVDARSLQEKIDFLESLKIEGDLVLNNLIEKAEEYVEQIHTINEDSIVVNINGTQTLR